MSLMSKAIPVADTSETEKGTIRNWLPCEKSASALEELAEKGMAPRPETEPEHGSDGE